MRIYLAGPITGKSYSDVITRIHKTMHYLTQYGYKVYNPLAAKDFLEGEPDLKASDYNNPIASNHAIFERDKWMVSNSDIVLADFRESTQASIGTCFELAWAAHLGIHTITVMQKSNIHYHSFVLEASDIVFDNLEDTLIYLEKLLKEGV